MRRNLLSTFALATCVAAFMTVVTAAPVHAQSAHKKVASSKSKKAPVRKAKASSKSDGAWRTVYTDASVNVAIDSTATHQNSDGTYNTRLRWRYTGDQRIGRNEAYRSMLQREMIDCSTLGVKPLAAETYTATGKKVSSFVSTQKELRTMDWAKRAPGTSASKAYSAVCGAVR